MKRAAKHRLAPKFRIGQLTRKKEFGSFDEDDDRSEEWDEEPKVDPNAPWYLRGAQVKVMEFVYFSERDESTASEGDVLGETDDDFSTIDDSEAEMSSSSSDNDDENKKEGEDEEDGEGEEETMDSKSSDALLEKRNDDLSVSSPSVASDSTSKMSDTVSAGSGFVNDSVRMNVNKKLAVSSEEQKEAEMNYRRKHGLKSVVEEDFLAYDMEKIREIREQLLGQKVALYEKDMSDYLTGKKREDAMTETIKGASYWRIRKTLKLLKVGDAFASQIALTLLMESDLDNPENHAAIDDTGSLELLVNLLNVDSSLCRFGALSVLDTITEVSEEMVEMTMNLGMVEELYKILLSNDDREVLVATRCLCNIVSNKRSRTVIRKAGLVPILFYLIHRVPMELLRIKLCDVYDEMKHRRYEIAMGSLYTLTAIMRSRQVREELFEYGYLSIIAPLLGSRERLVVKAILEGLVLCASLRKYRQRFEISGLVRTVLKHWKKHEEIVLRLMYKMSIGVVAREQIIGSEALTKVASFVMSTENMKRDPYGFKNALACLHRMGAHHQARDFFHKLGLLEPLIGLLKMDPADPYKLSICSILAQMSIYPENWKPIVELGGLQCILDIIFTRIADEWLIANCIKILGDVAHGDEAREILLENPDCLHFVLTLFSDERPMITRSAARAIIPLTRVYRDFSEIMKGEADSLEVMMDQLKPSLPGVDDNVKSALCEALAAVTCDQSILEILNSLGLVEKISNLIKTDNEGLQESLCLLISMSAITDKQITTLGKMGIIERLATFLKSSNIHVVIAAANALWRTSFDTRNAIRILNAGIVKQLLHWSMSEYQELSDASLGVLGNVRFAATCAEGIYKPGHAAVLPPDWSFPYHFKPQVFFHDDIELSST